MREPTRAELNYGNQAGRNHGRVIAEREVAAYGRMDGVMYAVLKDTTPPVYIRDPDIVLDLVIMPDLRIALQAITQHQLGKQEEYKLRLNQPVMICHPYRLRCCTKEHQPYTVELRPGHILRLINSVPRSNTGIVSIDYEVKTHYAVPVRKTDLQEMWG